MDTLRGDALREAIDQTLAELDRLESDVTGFFAEHLGPQAARAYQEALLGRTFETIAKQSPLAHPSER